MNIKEELTCQHCYEIYNHPITLPCGDNICKHHIEELISNSAANKFICPLCNETHSNENFKVNKLIEKLIKRELHDIKFNPKYVETLKNLKTEFQSLEAILKDPENYIDEEINRLNKQVDLDREKLMRANERTNERTNGRTDWLIQQKNYEIDKLADDLIKQLESFGTMFKTQYKAYVDLDFYKRLFESSKIQLAEFEKCLYLLSIEDEQREEEYKKSEKLVKTLQPNVNNIKNQMFSNSFLTYSQAEKSFRGSFGKLILNKDIRDKKDILGQQKKEFKGQYESLLVLANGDLVSGGNDGKIRRWNTKKGILMETLDGHRAFITDLVLVDSNCLISASGDRTIRVWSINEGSLKRTYTGHDGSVLALEILENGHLASASADKTIKIWNINDGALINTLKGHAGEVRTLVLLKNGHLASGSSDKSIKIWNYYFGSVIITLKGHTDCVFVLRLLKSGDLVSGSWDNTIKIWNTKDGTVTRIITARASFILSLKVLDIGYLVCGFGDGSIEIWDVENEILKREIKLNSAVNSLEVLQTGELVSASDQSIIIWN